MGSAREFHLSTILSITDGRLLSNDGIGGVYDILNYMTRDNLMTHQLPRAEKHCAPYILKEWPVLGSEAALRELEKLGDVITQARAAEDAGLDGLVKDAVEQWTKNFAATLDIPMYLSVSRVPGDDYCGKAPIEELQEMVGGDKPITVVES